MIAVNLRQLEATYDMKYEICNDVSMKNNLGWDTLWTHIWFMKFERTAMVKA